MAYDFNAEEVFEMAVRIEENGAAFYRKAAENLTDQSEIDFLETLARVEDLHKKTFEKMKEQVADMEKVQTVFDPDGELSLYLNAMADAHGGEGNPDVLELFTGKETLEDIITTAIGLEKESILFYVGLKDIVPEKFGRDKINDIIAEEKMHVAQLKGFLKKSGNRRG